MEEGAFVRHNNKPEYGIGKIIKIVLCLLRGTGDVRQVISVACSMINTSILFPDQGEI